MKNFLLCAALAIFSSVDSNAQGLVGNSDQIGNSGGLITTSTRKKNVNIDGSPFVNESYLPIELTTFEDRNFKGRYNAYNGDMEVLDDENGKVFVLDKAMDNYVVKFIGLNKAYKVYSYIDDDGYIESDFFITLREDEKVTFLQRERIIFLEEKVAESTYDRGRPASYKRVKDKFYILIAGENAQELPSKRKEIAKLFPDHSKEVLAFLKEHKTSTSDVEELTEFMVFLNTL
ncbi:MAG: hypothetical protein BM564_07015 [Bacteroidetes bacterium MedPE-SWsnd-G2]|nr:MAG: hypothetical protein BM564_07015 [Bacteroidetes bacterium MedPE-SWsnd-G2]